MAEGAEQHQACAPGLEVPYTHHMVPHGPRWNSPGQVEVSSTQISGRSGMFGTLCTGGTTGCTNITGTCLSVDRPDPDT